MTFEDIRPYISGAIGAAIALWCTSRWARKMPAYHGLKSAEQLVAENKWRIRMAGFFFITWLLLGLLGFKTGYFHENDWRAGGIVMGGSFFMPLAWLIASSAAFGREKLRESLLAFSISQKTPVKILYPIMILGGVLLLFSLFWPR